MTVSGSATAPPTDDRQDATLRQLDLWLRDAAARLNSDVSATDVQAAQRAIDDAERTLGDLVLDPWEPSLLPLRQAREILSSHLLAASVCEGADVAPPVTARVLRRGANSARRLLEQLSRGVHDTVVS
jgi:hypothetical protein